MLWALTRKIEGNRRLARALDSLRSARFESLFRDAPRSPLATIARRHNLSVRPLETPDEPFEQFSIPAFDSGADPEICLGASMASAKTRLPDDGAVVLLSKLNPRIRRIWRPVTAGKGKAVASPEFVALVPAEGVALAWLDAAVRYDKAFYDEILSRVSGTTGSRQRVRPTDVLDATIPSPPPVAVEAWVEFAQPQIELEDGLRRETSRLEDLRGELLPELISGRLTLLVDDDGMAPPGSPALADAPVAI